jgi:hypothetical protein
MFGNNLDVLTPEELPRGHGYETEAAAVELILDLIVLEDGLCVGPDESRLYEALNESLDLQRTAAQEAVSALDAGASVGKVFEIIRPLARHSPVTPEAERKLRHSRPIAATFAHEAIHHLINAIHARLLRLTPTKPLKIL